MVSKFHHFSASLQIRGFRFRLLFLLLKVKVLKNWAFALFDLGKCCRNFFSNWFYGLFMLDRWRRRFFLGLWFILFWRGQFDNFLVLFLTFELIDLYNNFTISLHFLEVFEKIRIFDNFFVSQWYLESINSIFIVKMVSHVKGSNFLL